jgi:hypothetical protein
LWAGVCLAHGVVVSVSRLEVPESEVALDPTKG